LFEWEGSPAEDVSLDATLNLVPRLQNGRAGLDRGDAAFDLLSPLGPGVWVGWSVETGQEFSGEFGACPFIEAECFSQNRGGCVSHNEPILRLHRPPNKRLQPTAAMEGLRVEGITAAAAETQR